MEIVINNSDNETEIHIENNSNSNADNNSSSNINNVQFMHENNAKKDFGSTKKEIVSLFVTDSVLKTSISYRCREHNFSIRR